MPTATESAPVTAPAADAVVPAVVAPVVAAVEAAKPATVLGSDKPADKPVEKTGEQPADPKASEPAPITLKAPEGTEVAAADLEAVAAFAKEQGLNQAQAEKVLARDLANRQAIAEQSQAALRHEADTTWVNEIKADAEIGGAKFAESCEIAKRGLEAFGTPKLKQILNETGLGNHPEMVRTFVKIGRLLADDKLIPPGQPAGSTPRLADKLFGQPSVQE